MEGLSKKEKGLMGMDNSMVIMGERGIKGLNGNEKNNKNMNEKMRINETKYHLADNMK